MTATRFASLARLFVPIGLGLFLLGFAGDVAHHALPANLSHDFDPLVGREAYRAHLVTMLGAATLMVALIWKGVNDIVTR